MDHTQMTPLGVRVWLCVRVCVCDNDTHAYHFGLLVDLTTGAIPSLYRLLVLEKFTTLKMTL